MHFLSATAFLAVVSLGTTYAAPFANPQEDLFGRKVDYEIVNVGGELSSSAAPEIETVTRTIKSTVTAPGSVPTPVTVTVTASPTSSTPYSSPVTPTSTPYSHGPAPPGASFFPPSSNFLRRGLNAAGDPYGFARGYGYSASSISSAVPTTPIAGRDNYDAWYPSVTATPSSSVSASSPLVARQWGSWHSSVPLPSTSAPSFSWSVPVPSASIVGRAYASHSWGLRASPTPYARRSFRNGPWSRPSSSATPSASFSLSPSATPLLY